MKRALLVLTLALSTLIAPLPLAPVSTAVAGDQEWAVAGKILTGLFTLGALHRASHRQILPPPQYAPPRQYAPAPAAPAPAPGRVWVEEHNVYQYRDVWVPGCWEKVWVPPVYETRTVQRGHAQVTERVLVAEGHYNQVWHDGYFRQEREVVCVPGHWE